MTINRSCKLIVGCFVLVQLLSFGFSSTAATTEAAPGKVTVAVRDQGARDFNRRQFLNRKDVLLVDLEFMQHGFDLFSVFGAPKGFVSSERPALLERYLKENTKGLVVFVGRTSKEVQSAIIMNVADMARAGQFETAHGNIYDIKNISFLLELEPDLGRAFGGSLKSRTERSYILSDLTHADFASKATVRCEDALD